MLLLCSTLAFVVPFAPSPAPQGTSDLPTVHHVLTYDANGSPPRWNVELEVAGLADAEGEVALELPDWGEWTDVDSYVLQGLESDPPLVPDEDEPHWFVVERPDRWNGKLRASYSLLTTRVHSRAQQAKGLLPWRSETYTHGFSSNTLMMPRVDRATLEVERTLHVRAPKRWTVITGWGGVAKGEQRIDVPAGGHNTVIAMGAPVGVRGEVRDGLRFDLVQFGGEADYTAELHATLERIAQDVAATSGQVLDEFRVVVTEPGFGGTRVEGAISVGASPSFLAGGADPYTLHFLAHELFHDWQPGDRDPGNGAMQWFFEGFTDYFALWHLVRVGAVDRGFFARRLLDIESEVSRHAEWETVSFGDESVRWRGCPNEDVAYKGGALFAFQIDVALREAGEPGLTALLRDFLAGGGFDHAWFRGWLDAHGLAELRARSFDGVERVDVAAALEAIGYARSDEEVHLTYFGIETTAPEEGRVVESIDPDGPSADRGLQVGDRIFGYYPTRSESVRVRPDLETPYRFGLTLFEPTISGWYVDVLRDGEELQIELEPWLSPGGLRAGIGPGPDGATDAFFADPPETDD